MHDEQHPPDGPKAQKACKQPAVHLCKPPPEVAAAAAAAVAAATTALLTPGNTPGGRVGRAIAAAALLRRDFLRMLVMPGCDEENKAPGTRVRGVSTIIHTVVEEEPIDWCKNPRNQARQDRYLL